MTSQLNVDAIVDKAGSGGTNVKIANTSVTVAEGGSATTTTVQGLAKVWSRVDHNDNNIRDSLNSGSLTDDGTGVFTISFTNNMNNALYSLVGTPHYGVGTNDMGTVGWEDGNLTTSAFSVYTMFILNGSGSGGGLQDGEEVMTSLHGDLA